MVPPIMEQAAKPKNRRRDVLVAHPPAPSRQLDEICSTTEHSPPFPCIAHRFLEPCSIRCQQVPQLYRKVRAHKRFVSDYLRPQYMVSLFGQFQTIDAPAGIVINQRGHSLHKRDTLRCAMHKLNRPSRRKRWPQWTRGTEYRFFSKRFSLHQLQSACLLSRLLLKQRDLSMGECH